MITLTCYRWAILTLERRVFWTDLPKSTGTLPATLPLFHSTESVNARDILKSGALSPTKCPVYAQNLLYLFYGKPSYRVGSATPATAIVDFYPFVLILDSSSIAYARRLMPFDSGALEHGLYKDYVHPRLKRINFEIPPPVENLQQVVKFYFGSNKAYISGKGRGGRKVRPTQFELAAVDRMISSSALSTSDSRRMTFEVQTGRKVRLENSSFRGVIAPSVFADEPYFQKARSRWKFDAEFYDVHLGVPLEVQALIYDKSQALLKKWGLT